MIVPETEAVTPPQTSLAPTPGWAGLAPEAKRARILEAAIDVFSERGLEAPMHEVAGAAGAGVASIYRIFPSKHDLWAAIVIRRVEEMSAAFEEAEHRPGDRWSAFVEVVSAHVARQSPEPFFNEARAIVEDRPEVTEALARATAVQERLLAATRAEGRLRADATAEDLRLLFAATRAARRHDLQRVPRMVELMLDAFDTRRG